MAMEVLLDSNCSEEQAETEAGSAVLYGENAALDAAYAAEHGASGGWAGFAPRRQEGLGLLERYFGGPAEALTLQPAARAPESARSGAGAMDSESEPTDPAAVGPLSSMGFGPASVEGWDLRMGYGPFMQEYRIGGRLVAFTILDILPARVCSVYFVWDSDLRAMQLGTVSGLRELAFVWRLSAFSPQLRHLDLNYYVPRCPKMNYKR